MYTFWIMTEHGNLLLVSGYPVSIDHAAFCYAALRGVQAAVYSVELVGKE